MIQLISITPDKAQDYIAIENSSPEKVQKRTISVKKSNNPNVAIIPVKGYAYDTDNWKTELGAGFSYEGLERQIDEAIANNAQTILFDIDTPGGCGIGAESLVEKIYSLREQGIRTIAQVHNICCSAGYRLASQCSEIYAPNDGYVGCLGTYTVVYDTSEALKKDGIKTFLISSGGVKGVGAIGTEITEEYKKALQKQVDELNGRFKEEVARGRANLTPEQVDELFSGETWLGRQALSKGLIDKRQTLTQTLKMLKENVKMTNENEEKTVPQTEAAAPAVVTVAELDNLKMASADFKLDCLRKGLTADGAKQSYLEYLENENKELREKLQSQPMAHEEHSEPEPEQKEEAPLTIPGNTMAVNTANLEMARTTSEIVAEQAKKYAQENGVSFQDAVYTILNSDAQLAKKYMEENTNG